MQSSSLVIKNACMYGRVMIGKFWFQCFDIFCSRTDFSYRFFLTRRILQEIRNFNKRIKIKQKQSDHIEPLTYFSECCKFYMVLKQIQFFISETFFFFMTAVERLKYLSQNLDTFPLIIDCDTYLIIEDKLLLQH